jgi:hypothetical protein
VASAEAQTPDEVHAPLLKKDTAHAKTNTRYYKGAITKGIVTTVTYN